MTDPRIPPGTVEIERRRVRHVRRVLSMRPYLALLLILMGVATLVTELSRYWFRDHAIGGAVVAIGALFSFVGFFMLDSRDALVGARFVVDSFTQIIGSVRTGRRAGDRAVVVVPPPDVPTDETKKP